MSDMRVLIIDDEEDVRASLALLLESSGWDVEQLGNAQNLVALAPGQRRQFGDGEHEHAPGARHRHQQIRFRILHPLGRQHQGPLGKGQCGFPSLLLAHQIPKTAEEPIACARGHQHRAVRRAHHDPRKAGAGGDRQAPREGLALAPSAGKAVGREGVGAPRGIKEDQGFVTFPPGHVGELIAAAIGKLPGIKLMALGGPHPAFF